MESPREKNSGASEARYARSYDTDMGRISVCHFLTVLIHFRACRSTFGDKYHSMAQWNRPQPRAVGRDATSVSANPGDRWQWGDD